MTDSPEPDDAERKRAAEDAGRAALESVLCRLPGRRARRKRWADHETYARFLAGRPARPHKAKRRSRLLPPHRRRGRPVKFSEHPVEYDRPLLIVDHRPGRAPSGLPGHPPALTNRSLLAEIARHGPYTVRHRLTREHSPRGAFLKLDSAPDQATPPWVEAVIVPVGYVARHGHGPRAKGGWVRGVIGRPTTMPRS